MPEIKLTLKESDIPEDSIWREIADNIGIEHLLILSKICKGEKLHIPRPEYFYNFCKKSPKE